jgi:hypothetical protein
METGRPSSPPAASRIREAGSADRDRGLHALEDEDHTLSDLSVTLTAGDDLVRISVEDARVVIGHLMEACDKLNHWNAYRLGVDAAKYGLA